MEEGEWLDRLEAIRSLVVEAVSLVSEACRSGCARSECEAVEDALAEAMDEAEEAARMGSPWLRLAGLQRAARLLERLAAVLMEKGCREEAGLFREAARRLSMADALA